jgi:polysaccharide pyruvyl transferase WcaK-like protein
VDSTTPGAVRFTLQRLAPWLSACSARDAASAAVLRGWGIDAEVVGDLSLFLEPSPASRGRALLAAAGIEGGRPCVGLALTAVEPALGALMATAVPAVVSRRPDLQFCLVPMSRHPRAPRHNDLALARRLQASCAGVPILEDVSDPADVLAVFAEFSVALCMRYHAFWFAHRGGTPIVAVPYAEKCRTWVAEHCVPSVPADDAERMVAALEAALEGAGAPA